MKNESPWMLERYRKFLDLREFLASYLKAKTKDLGSWYVKELNSMGMEFQNGQVVIESSGWADTYLLDSDDSSEYDKYLDGEDQGGMDIVTTLHINKAGRKKNSHPKKDIIM
eukprot:TRINITY_DN8531_c0_g2_i1.p2 TRINITY_DN8531_c0_g2~~TRINITY_DN8531_c0_g2_i1.p2  ORF type:complete len:112 (+),score=23.84 TRINITY_DN8531_c0_g2_i1:225-560(+)